MKNRDSFNVVVLGGGPSGLSVAWNLVQDGYKVTLIERSPTCGGMTQTFERGGYRYDLGPHNIHPQRKSIINFLKKNLGEQFIQHDFRAQIYFRGRRTSYPFEGADIFKSMDPLTLLSCAASFVWTRFRTTLLPAYQDDGSFKTWVVNRFGSQFYNIYFGPYSQKVWGVPPDQISEIVAKKRIAVKGIIELAHSIIHKKIHYHPENPRAIDNFYPQNGVGAITDFFLQGFLENGGTMLTNTTVNKILMEQGLVREIILNNNGQEKKISFRHQSGEPDGILVSSIPINTLITTLEGDIPENVVAAASGLDYVAMVLLFINVKRRDVFNVPLMYFSEAEFPFNRAYDVGLFSRRMVPEGKNALCLELTGDVGDKTWKSDDRTLFESCLAPLEKHGLLKRSDVEDYHTWRLENAYPRFRIGYEKKLLTVFDYLDKTKNMFSLGRQGLFSYANVDDAIWMGFQIAKEINYMHRISLPVKELLPNYIDH